MKKIGEYGFLSDGRSCALVHRTGAIEWACFPRFDTEAFFTSLLGDKENGFWSLIPDGILEIKRRYLEDTNILISNFTCREGELELTDFMPTGDEQGIIRNLRVVKGKVDIRETLFLRSDYGRHSPEVEIDSERVLFKFKNADISYLCPSNRPVQKKKDGIERNFSLKQGEELQAGIFYKNKGDSLNVISFEDSLIRTEAYWKSWSRQTIHSSEYRKNVIRSSLTLKGLIHERSGAMIAAPTTSLPETIGGERNWDYRYSWIRDSVFIVNAFTKINHTEEAKRFFNWVLKSLEKNAFKLPVGFDLDGKKVDHEKHRLELSGFRGSKPVRIGNKGLDQFQLDVYGEFLICLNHCWKNRLIEADVDLEALLFHLINELLQKQKQPDQGIWEARSEPRFYTYSQAMACMGLEKGMELYQELGGKRLNMDMIERTKEKIKKEVFEKGVDKERNCLVQDYGSKYLDAANLRLGIMGFIPPNHSVMMNTAEEVLKDLYHQGAVYRYKSADGLGGDEGAFIACGFWLSEVLALQSRITKAKNVFESLLKLSNDLGLFSEEYDGDKKELLGNFPQAFSHLGVINAAVAINKNESQTTP